MRDNKISLLLLASFLLLLASFLVLCTWGYNFYTKVEKASTKLEQPQTFPDPAATRDSLIALYTQTIQKFDQKLSGAWMNADSLEQDLKFKLDEYYRVKDELSTMLQNPSTTFNSEAARSKIAELQQKIRLLENTNQNVTAENRKLYALLEQMKNNSRQTPVQTSSPQPKAVNVVQSTKTEENKSKPENSVLLNVFDLELSAIKAEDEDELSGIMGSFILKNLSSYNDAELMIVVTQPNGKVVQKSAWESGTFTTREGKKIYSCKMYVENSRGETKRLSFSLNNEKYQKGNYTFQIFHKGQSLGKINKYLS